MTREKFEELFDKIGDCEYFVCATKLDDSSHAVMFHGEVEYIISTAIPCIF